MQKSGIVFVGLVLSSMVLMFHGVSAGPMDDINNALDEIVSGLEPLFKLVVGSEYAQDSTYVFASILIFVIVLSIIWVVLDKVPFFGGNRTVLWIVSIAVSLLSVRFISSREIVNAIVLPYTTIGIVISAGLPFVLFFFVVEKGLEGANHKFVRKFSWIAFAVVFIGLWFSRYDQLKAAAWAYPVIAFVSLLLAFMDGTVQKFFLRLKLDKVGAESSSDAIDELQTKLDNVNDLLRRRIIDRPEAERRRREYRRRIADFSR